LPSLEGGVLNVELYLASPNIEPNTGAKDPFQNAN
jgi:hypothetical protein